MSAGRRRVDALTAAAAAGTAAFCLLAILAPVLAPFDPLASDLSRAFQPPSPRHLAGTDELGRDLLSRIVWAARLDLLIASGAVALSVLVGAPLGAFCGFVGGPIDAAVGRLVDALGAFPLFVLAMAVVAALGNRVESVVVATALVNLPFHIRLARAEVGARRDAGWMEAARAGGESDGTILALHLLPLILPALAVGVSLNLGWAILNAAGLSFLGLGIRPPTPEWGILVADGARFVASGRWWLVVCPGVALAGAVLCFNLLGDGLRDVLDPRSRP